jgi:hypothetical protein
MHINMERTWKSQQGILVEVQESAMEFELS